MRTSRISAVAATLATAIGIAACGSSSSSSSSSGSSSAAPAPSAAGSSSSSGGGGGAATLNGAGSTLAAPIYLAKLNEQQVLQVIRVLGVDDWAWCKGQNFGTILVDLECSQVVDLLPTRSADSFGEWLAQHPEVTTVSRDRQGVYAEGVRRSAPAAVQVADRFHLVLNLTQAVERDLLSIGGSFESPP